jgi:hypothetical protein
MTIVFATFLAVCLAGVLDASWWAAVAGACVLALVSMSNHAAYSVADGGFVRPGTLLLSSCLNAALSAAGALATGRLIGWLWGV